MGILDGKVAAITGAGRGIGRGEALLFAQEGARVVVNDLGGDWDGSGADTRAASQVVEEVVAAGGEAVAHFEDISEEAGAASLIRTALDSFGRLDAVVNNAGILRDKMVFNMSAEDWDAVMKVHLRGHFLVTRAAAQHWRDASKAATEPVRAANITGQVFYIAGGLVQLYQGWTPVGELSKDDRWTPAELADSIGELFGDRPTVYSPVRSEFRKAAGIGGVG